MGSEPVGYVQAWPRVWTRDYREQILLAVRAGLKLEASELQVQLGHVASSHKPAVSRLMSSEATCCGRVLCGISLLTNYPRHFIFQFLTTLKYNSLKIPPPLIFIYRPSGQYMESLIVVSSSTFFGLDWAKALMRFSAKETVFRQSRYGFGRPKTSLAGFTTR